MAPAHSTLKCSAPAKQVKRRMMTGCKLLLPSGSLQPAQLATNTACVHCCRWPAVLCVPALNLIRMYR